MRFLEVAEQLRARLAIGDVGPGGALPSEAALGAEFGTSRVTIRRALERLRAEGLLNARKGAGWFASLDPVRQALGRVTTVEAALEAAGATPSRRVLEFGFESASADIARALDLGTAAEVLRVRRLNLADAEPFALVTVWVPGDVGSFLSRSEVEVATFYELLPVQGIELGRALQTIGADVATDDDATLLHVQAGDPLLTARRVTFTRAGRPLLLSLHRYPAARTSFEIELSSVAFAGAIHTGESHG